MRITASKLYNFIQCEHRVWRDQYGPKEEKIIETNPFVQMLWDKGVAYEKEVISKMGDFMDMSGIGFEEAADLTIIAMNKKTPLIYQGVLIYKDLMGIPDLLKLMPDGSYIPIDIKSGMALEGVDEEEGDDGKQKKHYAIQLALYSEALNGLGFENKRLGIILDIKGNEVLYDLNLPMGKVIKMSYWDYYESIKNKAILLLSNEVQNKPAMAGICKLCPWYNSCKKWVIDNDDPTSLFYVGRSKRDVLSDDLQIHKTDEILKIDIDEIMAQKKKDKNFLKGLGEKTIGKMMDRANVLKNLKVPVIYEKIELPVVSYELFFDIEDDPTREFVYMHGVYERGPEGERYLDFTAKEINPAAEKEAWSNFWQYIKGLPKEDYSVYYYSHHEKTTYKRMQKMYPEVISEEEVDAFFENPNVIDLYQTVLKYTDWPVGSYSIKYLAQYLGFKWRDETPSGALSIQWFNEYIETKDPKKLERILLYNEDDCKATMVLKDGIKKLSDSIK
jgi:uncharacterized protein